MPIRLALVGYGKIARDSHVPAIAANPAFALTAIADPLGDPGRGLPWFADHAALLASGRADAVAICTPPGARAEIALAALAAGHHVLLEKPPAATPAALETLIAAARASGRALYAAWHSQHAPAVAAAAALLEGKKVARLRVEWREDVRKWHPGQHWIWEKDGFGVFDPGINALSICTRILPDAPRLDAATLFIPANKAAPIAASLAFANDGTAEFDWRHDAGEQWTIEIETGEGSRIELHDGGARLIVDDAPQPVGGSGEYESIYARFAALVAAGEVEVDAAPLAIVTKALQIGQRETVAAFE